MAKKTKQQQAKAMATTRKPAGTRVGTLADWRVGGAKGAGESSAARRGRLRDGR